MTETVCEFEKFPWFGGERRPVLVSGTVLCRLTKLVEPSNKGDPCRVSFVVEHVEFRSGPLLVVNFNGDQKDKEDFNAWLKSRYGITISNQLRNAHRLGALPTTEDA